jgi:predicted transcriptional regulator
MRLIPQLDDRQVFALRTFGRWVRHLRDELALGQAVLGERSGSSQATISRLENGLVPNMPLHRVAQILVALDALPGSRSRAATPSHFGSGTTLSDEEAEQLLERLIG